MKKNSQQQWNHLLENFHNAHFLQTSEWAQVKALVGWKNDELIWEDDNGLVVAAANILQKRIRIKGFTLPLSILYVPRGPILNWEDTQLSNRVLTDLENYAEKSKAIFIKIDPEIPIAIGAPAAEDEKVFSVGNRITAEFKNQGWCYSQDQIQFKNTVKIDLTPDVDTLLSQMKQKTRYNIRLAERKGVIIRKGSPQDYETLYRMYAETALRDNFVIRSKEYYFHVWHLFFESELLTPLIASVNGNDIAALMLFHFGETAWYVYGMSRDSHRNLMPTYLLQWQAILTAKEKGCTVYDLWGAPDVFDETDSMWGVYRFKQGLGGETVRTIGAYDYPNKPILYKFYLQILPKLLDILRKKGIEQTRNSLD